MVERLQLYGLERVDGAVLVSNRLGSTRSCVLNTFDHSMRRTAAAIETLRGSHKFDSIQIQQQTTGNSHFEQQDANWYIVGFS